MYVEDILKSWNTKRGTTFPKEFRLQGMALASRSWSSSGRYTAEIIFIMADLFLSLDAGASEQLSLKLPPNVVEDSARAFFSVLGESAALVDYHTMLTRSTTFFSIYTFSK